MDPMGVGVPPAMDQQPGMGQMPPEVRMKIMQALMSGMQGMQEIPGQMRAATAGMPQGSALAIPAGALQGFLRGLAAKNMQPNGMPPAPQIPGL